MMGWRSHHVKRVVKATLAVEFCHDELRVQHDVLSQIIVYWDYLRT